MSSRGVHRLERTLAQVGFGRELPRLVTGSRAIRPSFSSVSTRGTSRTTWVTPRAYYVDRVREEGWVLETCIYFPFVTAKNLTVSEATTRL